MNRAAWQRARAAFAARSRRERGLLVGVAIALLLLAGQVLWIEPAQLQRKRLQQTIEQQQGQVQDLTLQLQTLQGRQQDPDAARRAQIDVLRKGLARVDDDFLQLQRALVAPQDMGRLIESLLKQHGSLQLLSARSLPVAPLRDGLAGARAAMAGAPPAAHAASPTVAAAAAAVAGPPASAAAVAAAAGSAPRASADADAWLYLHGVQISVRGSYADMQAYLEQIERLPRRVYWGALSIDGKAWPASVMTVTLYTVSLERTWWTL